MTIHRHLDDELEKLDALLTGMFDLVEQQLADAIRAVLHRDARLAASVRRRDDDVDEMEMALDRQCEYILALQQPVAVDLRLLVAAIKTNTDLERIGDYSANLAKYTRYLRVLPKEVLAEAHVEDLSRCVQSTFARVRRAYFDRDSEAAQQIVPLDREVDRLYKEAVAKIIAIGEAQAQFAPGLVYLVNVIRALERIGDHLVNIAESVVFQVNGLDVRHTRLHRGHRAG